MRSLEKPFKHDVEANLNDGYVFQLFKVLEANR